MEWTERLTYTCATRIYPNSGKLADFLLDHKFCKPAKVQVLGNGSSNGIDTSFFQTNEALVQTATALHKKLALEPRHFVFVFIGRVVRDKGIEELVTAFTELKKTHPHIKLLLVGPYEPALDPLSKETLAAITNDDDIIQVDFQQDIRPWLLISQVLVFPSYREGFPNVPMQAGCFRLPAIVTDINGCNEIIEQGQNGLLIPVKNKAALREAMETLLTNKALYAHMQTRARQLITERYDQKHFWSLLLHEYQQLLNQHALVS
ncbi:glycosyltransferase [Paraflavitalea speifideaquila]|uniref:glycosyltransferase n=1 Tax=Paraflavitalea speifideaquila TaxID=3076558 RepID=UPI0028EB6E96|nr:glycosyltransferase [Paraflavitalea speifideiaquila]